MRKRAVTQCHNKIQYGSQMNRNFMAIIILHNQKFYHTDVEPKKIKSTSLDTYIEFIHCVELHITFDQKFILFGSKHSTNSTATK